MIKIGRVKVEINTRDGVFGLDESFDKELNIICSEQNTTGKSSLIAGIYYGLGLEEIIGGKGEKVLSSAFKSLIKNGEKEIKVLQSGVYLEIENNERCITIYRAAKMENRHSNLMTIYYSELSKIYNKETFSEDMYVHSHNSATSKKGFFTFLEQFLGFDLPKVPGNDDSEKKLYLQLIFSSMLIEQKRGWADIFSGMPHFGIKDAKKRVIEFILNMDTLKNEKLKHELKVKEKNIKENWRHFHNETIQQLNEMELKIKGVIDNPEILNDPEKSIYIYYNSGEKVYSLKEYITILKEDYDKLVNYTPKDIENFNELQEELNKIEEDMANKGNELKELNYQLQNEKISLKKLNNSLQIIKTDILNNQDAKKLRDMGSKEEFKSFNDKCPTCNQTISDTLLVSQNTSEVMSIDENIRHLKSQEKVFEHAMNQKKSNIEKFEDTINKINHNLTTLQKLARVTRNDIYTIDGEISERIIYKKIELVKMIEKLETINVDSIITYFKDLSSQWSKYLQEREKLPKNKFTESDEKKLKLLRNNFVMNLQKFGYRSANLNKVMISRNTYLPIIENFDLKFDSSASDNIRGIWAFTIALVQTSNTLDGNHPGILIFDEPGQHSIEVNHISAFLTSLEVISKNNQIVIGVTMKETDTKNLIHERISEGTNAIVIKGRAFRRFE